MSVVITGAVFWPFRCDAEAYWIGANVLYPTILFYVEDGWPLVRVIHFGYLPGRVYPTYVMTEGIRVYEFITVDHFLLFLLICFFSSLVSFC